jgi:23S rRNA (uracil1939-C5)-methyltransferase
LRTLTIRNTSHDQWMVLVMFGQPNDVFIPMVMNHLQTTFPWLTSLLYVINEKPNETLDGQTVLTWSGEAQIVERFEDIEYIISPKSFFQTNSDQALRLYQLTREMAGLTGKENVYDLYTGTGSIALFVAKHAAKVVGVEYVEDAVVDARKNAERNGITNASFFAGDMKDLLNDEFIATHGKPDVIITDPPRAGMHPDVVAMLNRLGAARIVYVSCNPATQARDLDLMREHYRLVKYQPVDMFPQTAHVENIALLERIA